MKMKKIKYASDCKGNNEKRGRVSNTVEAASATLKYFKEIHHNSGDHSMFGSAHLQCINRLFLKVCGHNTLS